jgi:hypothetical protein
MRRATSRSSTTPTSRSSLVWAGSRSSPPITLWRRRPGGHGDNFCAGTRNHRRRRGHSTRVRRKGGHRPGLRARRRPDPARVRRPRRDQGPPGQGRTALSVPIGSCRGTTTAPAVSGLRRRRWSVVLTQRFRPGRAPELAGGGEHAMTSVAPIGPRPGWALPRTVGRRTLVLRSTTHVPPAWRERVGATIDWTWTFRLTALPGGRTRMHLRVRGRTAPACAPPAPSGPTRGAARRPRMGRSLPASSPPILSGGTPGPLRTCCISRAWSHAGRCRGPR